MDNEVAGVARGQTGSGSVDYGKNFLFHSVSRGHLGVEIRKVIL